MSKAGFGSEELKDIALRSGETATLKVKLLVGSEKAEVTVYGTAEGVRADAQIGRRLDSPQIDETPILGRKVTTLPLLNSAFRQAKGTGDLFVNQTYFVTGAGSRRTTTTTLDGANNDEAWGRQTMIATVPLGAVQEMTVLSNAFSSEFGWTAGPALNIVTKSGTNGVHGEALYMGRPGDMQAKTFSTKNFCAPSVPTCVTPGTLTSISPVDVPDSLSQFSGSFGGPLVKDKTFFFVTGDYTRQDRTTFLSSTLPAFVLPADGNLAYTGHYRQALVNGRLDHKLTPNQTLMLRVNVDRFHDDNPQDAVGGTSAPSVARRYARRSWTGQLNHTCGAQREPSQRGARRLPGWRPGHALGGADTLHHLHTQRDPCRSPSDSREPPNLYRSPGAVLRHAVVVAWQAPPPLRRQRDPSHLRRLRQRARHRGPRHVHVQEHDDGAASIN